MSMHDVEGFAEEAVSFVGQCAIADDGKIALIHNIYAFHDLWDTGFTKLRVYDTLLATGYWHAFEPPEHPDYEKYQEFFDNLEDSNNFYIYENPLEESGPITSYWVDSVHTDGEEYEVQKLCCEAGSALWAHYTGRPQPPDQPPAQMMLDLARLAAPARAFGLLTDIYNMMFYIFCDGVEENLLEELKTLVFHDEVFKLLRQRRSLPDDEMDDLPEASAQWYAGYQDWLEAAGLEQEAKPEPPAELVRQAALAANGVKEFSAAASARDVAKALDIYAELQQGAALDFVGEYMIAHFLGLRFLESLSEEELEKYLALAEAGTENPYLADFLQTLKDWNQNRENKIFYARRAAVLLNQGKPMAAREYISKGLSLDPADDMLRLYRAALVIADGPISVSEAGEQAPVVAELLAKDDFPHKAYATYLLGMLYYYSGRRKLAKATMKKAVQLNPLNQVVYDRYFAPKKKK